MWLDLVSYFYYIIVKFELISKLRDNFRLFRAQIVSKPFFSFGTDNRACLI